MSALLDKHDAEFLKFDRIAMPRSFRADLHAFLMLDSLVPGEYDIVSAAEHDEIYLSVDVAKLSAVVTEGQVIDLVRCGVRYVAEQEALAMFV
jgi:hypothetical protein